MSKKFINPRDHRFQFQKVLLNYSNKDWVVLKNEEEDQWVRAPTVLPEDWDLFLGQKWQLTNIRRASSALFCPLQVLHPHGTQTFIQANTSTDKIKANKCSKQRLGGADVETDVSVDGTDPDSVNQQECRRTDSQWRTLGPHVPNI